MLFILLALGVFLFILSPGINTKLYSDNFIMEHSSNYGWSHYFETPDGRNYRPLKYCFFAWAFDLAGKQTWVIHGIQIILHLGFAALIFYGIFKIGFSKKIALIAVLVFCFSQLIPFPLLSSHSFDQITSTFSGVTALLFLVLYFSSESNVSIIYYILALFSFGLCLLSKETGTSFSIILSLFILVKCIGMSKPVLKKLFYVILLEIPFSLILLNYILLRLVLSANMPTIGGDNYNFSFGINIINNFALLFYALITPISTVDTFIAYYNNNLSYIFFSVFFTFVIFLIICLGIIYNKNNFGELIFLIVCIFLAQIPMVFMNHVSELYLYNSLPFFSGVAAISFVNIFNKFKNIPLAKLFFSLMFISLILANSCASFSKAGMMKANGEKAYKMAQQLKNIIQQSPAVKNIVIIDPFFYQPQYSAFLMKSPFHLLLAWDVNLATHSNGIQLFHIGATERYSQKLPSNSKILRLDEDGVSLKIVTVNEIPQ